MQKKWVQWKVPGICISPTVRMFCMQYFLQTMTMTRLSRCLVQKWKKCLSVCVCAPTGPKLGSEPVRVCSKALILIHYKFSRPGKPENIELEDHDDASRNFLVCVRPRPRQRWLKVEVDEDEGNRWISTVSLSHHHRITSWSVWFGV